mmetsp:Transcript_61609/g.123483  ORF Transcript_61609/g.123483 Transcript_61609/m.123483 type:complete len:140 (-) Transcript_61609:134-553(-)
MGAVLEPGLEVRMDFGSGRSWARIPPPPGSPLVFEEPPRPRARHDRREGAGQRSPAVADKAEADRPLLEWGCKVLVSSDADEVKRLLRRNWEPAMEEFCGQKGTVTHIDVEGDVSVEFESEGSWKTWTYKAEALTRLPA